MLIGIDLGTTNSLVAIWRDGRSELVPNALGELLTPSAVSITARGQSYVGAAALDRLGAHPDETVTSFKRLMGTDKTVRLAKRDWRAEDLSALVLSSLRDDVAAFTGETPTEAVITVPAYFNDRQRKATRRAGELAGLTVRRLINEPTAAALAFGLQDRGDREPFLVFDLGGGTFDVSIVEMFDGIIEVRASAGDNRLGGDDFDLALAAYMRGRIDPEGVLDKLSADRRSALLKIAAERARRRLSEADEAPFEIVAEDRKLSATVTADEFETAVEPLLKRLRDPVVRAMRDCSIDAGALSEIVLVGGATRMPVVRRAITRMFARFPNSGVHPDHAVALGAAVQAGLLGRDAALDEIRITDVCPFTLGVDNAERDGHGNLHYGLFSPIIDRNTPIPVSRMQYYRTLADNQRELEFNIYQGEAREVAGNIKLGTVKIPVPPRPAGQVHAEVRLSYDTSGLLEVDVTVPESGLTRNLVIVDEEDRQDARELELRRAALAKLKFHPREEAGNVALLERARRCYEEFIGDERQMIGGWITEFEAALDRQDPHHICEVQALLERNLAMVEGRSPL